MYYDRLDMTANHIMPHSVWSVMPTGHFLNYYLIFIFFVSQTLKSSARPAEAIGLARPTEIAGRALVGCAIYQTDPFDKFMLYQCF